MDILLGRLLLNIASLRYSERYYLFRQTLLIYKFLVVKLTTNQYQYYRDIDIVIYRLNTLLFSRVYSQYRILLILIRWYIKQRVTLSQSQMTCIRPEVRQLESTTSVSRESRSGTSTSVPYKRATFLGNKPRFTNPRSRK